MIGIDGRDEQVDVDSRRTVGRRRNAELYVGNEKLDVGDSPPLLKFLELRVVGDRHVICDADDLDFVLCLDDSKVFPPVAELIVKSGLWRMNVKVPPSPL